jgi:hypothetical protein
MFTVSTERIIAHTEKGGERMRNQLFITVGFMLAFVVGVAHGQEQPPPVAVPTPARSNAASRCAEIRRLLASGRDIIVTPGTCDEYGGPTSLSSALKSAQLRKQLQTKSRTDRTRTYAEGKAPARVVLNPISAPPTLASGRDTPE